MANNTRITGSTNLAAAAALTLPLVGMADLADLEAVWADAGPMRPLSPEAAAAEAAAFLLPDVPEAAPGAGPPPPLPKAVEPATPAPRTGQTPLPKAVGPATPAPQARQTPPPAPSAPTKRPTKGAASGKRKRTEFEGVTECSSQPGFQFNVVTTPTPTTTTNKKQARYTSPARSPFPSAEAAAIARRSFMLESTWMSALHPGGLPETIRKRLANGPPRRTNMPIGVRKNTNGHGYTARVKRATTIQGGAPVGERRRRGRFTIPGARGTMVQIGTYSTVKEAEQAVKDHMRHAVRRAEAATALDALAAPQPSGASASA